MNDGLSLKYLDVKHLSAVNLFTVFGPLAVSDGVAAEVIAEGGTTNVQCVGAVLDQLRSFDKFKVVLQ